MSKKNAPRLGIHFNDRGIIVPQANGAMHILRSIQGSLCHYYDQNCIQATSGATS
jgi:hypothetical protein